MGNVAVSYAKANELTIDKRNNGSKIIIMKKLGDDYNRWYCCSDLSVIC